MQGARQSILGGDDIDSSKAKYDSGDGSEKGTVPVGSYSANAFGVHNTAGNVEEMIEDCWHKTYKDAPTDGSAWLSENEGNCERRVKRGSAWNSRAEVLRSAFRWRIRAKSRNYFSGFRIARTLSQ